MKATSPVGAFLRPQRGTVRRFSVLIAATVVCSSVFAGQLLRPSSAQAWAWSDSCTFLAYNGTGSQGSVHPVLYIPILPSAAGEATFATFAVVGIPTSGAIPFRNTGYPVPSYGCHATLNFVNPGSNVGCVASAPTTGANHFSCGGNARVKITDDSDDITGEVHIPSTTRVSGPRPKPTLPARAPAALRKSDLPGTGWRATSNVARLGRLGKLMSTDTPPASCRNASRGPAPVAVGGALFARRGGADWAGATNVTFATAAQARATVADAMSNSSVGCLRRLLTSARIGTTATSSQLPTGGLGNGLRTSQVVVRQGVGGRVKGTSYLDVVATSKGRRMSLVLLGSTTSPTSATVERAAVRAALRRIGA